MSEWLAAARLVAVAALLAVALAVTAAWTMPQIERNRAKETLRHVHALIGDHASRSWNAEQAEQTLVTCDGRWLAQRRVTGYGGDMVVLLLAGPDGPINLRVPRHNETPGLGDFITDPSDPWVRALLATPVADIASLDGVTGATITSRALADAVAALSQPPEGTCQ